MASEHLDNSVSPDDASLRDEVAKLFARHHRWLFSYLVTLLGNADAAEEVYQDVSVVVWRDYAKFRPGTDFVRWVAVIANYQVRRFRRQQRRQPLPLREETIELIAEEVAVRSDLVESRRVALASCMKNLVEIDRVLVEEYYGQEATTIDELSVKLGRPSNTLYKALGRIRRSLYECIERKMRREDRE